jgi:hypothetical protein
MTLAKVPRGGARRGAETPASAPRTRPNAKPLVGRPCRVHETR